MSFTWRRSRHHMERPWGAPLDPKQSPTLSSTTPTHPVPQDPPEGLSMPYLKPLHTIDITATSKKLFYGTFHVSISPSSIYGSSLHRSAASKYLSEFSYLNVSLCKLPSAAEHLKSVFPSFPFSLSLLEDQEQVEQEAIPRDLVVMKEFELWIAQFWAKPPGLVSGN